MEERTKYKNVRGVIIQYHSTQLLQKLNQQLRNRNPDDCTNYVLMDTSTS